MLVGIFGNLGCGKTLTLVFLSCLYKLEKNAFVCANFKNACADIIKSAEELLVNIEEYQRKRLNLFALDELGRILEATAWMSDINTILSRIFTESRKRGFDIIYTSQSALMVDRNVRRVTDIVLIPEFNTKTEVIKVTAFEPKGVGAWFGSEFEFNAKQYYEIFDTYEIIEADKFKVIDYYLKQLKSNSKLLNRINQMTKKSERVNTLEFYYSIRRKLAEQVLISLYQS